MALMTNAGDHTLIALAWNAGKRQQMLVSTCGTVEQATHVRSPCTDGGNFQA